MKFTMYEFALMPRFIELGKRYGLEPWQWGVEYDRATGATYLASSPIGQDANNRFDEMLKALGVTREDPATATGPTILPYEEGEEMLQAIDQAIKNAPRKWAR